jgi:alanyl-tRNA synthetase/misacylated tRNA(Ala) deacylase
MSDGEALRKELAKVLGEKEWKAATRLAFLTAQSGDREKGKAVEGQDEVDGKPQGVVVFFDRAEAVTHDFDFLGLLATSVQAASESSTGDRPLYPLTICLSGLNTTPGGLLLVQSKDDALAKSVKERISAALNGLPISTDSGSTTPAQGAGEAKGDGEAGGGAKSAKAVPRVKGGGAKGRYMCKIDGKLGKREREAVEKVVEEIRVELAAA